MTISKSNLRACSRISRKLRQLRRLDPNFEIFGASTHRYSHAPVLSKQELGEIEAIAGFQLPSAFRAYLLLIGNGGIGKYGGAGPAYGVSTISKTSLSSQSLKNKCKITPAMTDTEWKELTKGWDIDDLSLAEETAIDEVIYGGVLHLSATGCGGWDGLVVNGPHKGRIITFGDMTAGYTQHASFLEWYENWLDESIEIQRKRFRNKRGKLLAFIPWPRKDH